MDALQVPRRSLTWQEFRAILSSEDPSRTVLYRGQANAALGLVPSLYRLSGRPRVDRYVSELLPDLYRAVAPYLELELDLARPAHVERFLGILRAHDFPTPLLDWTRSADVAAYFAFSQLERSAVRSVTIWKFTPDAISARNAPVEILFPRQDDHRSLVLQQGLYTRSLTEESLESALAHSDEPSGGAVPLERYDLPADQAPRALDDLTRRGIHAGTLFAPGDATCQRLAQELAFERQRLGL